MVGLAITGCSVVVVVVEVVGVASCGVVVLDGAMTIRGWGVVVVVVGETSDGAGAPPT